jgi:hypothetical protein
VTSGENEQKINIIGHLLQSLKNPAVLQPHQWLCTHSLSFYQVISRVAVVTSERMSITIAVQPLNISTEGVASLSKMSFLTFGLGPENRTRGHR